MKSIIISILALAAIACDGGSNDTTEPGVPGVAVSNLSTWNFEECPVGLERVGDYCVAGTVDMQLDVDDCAAVAHCFDAARDAFGEIAPMNCAVAAVEGHLDAVAFPGGVSNWEYRGADAARANYLSWHTQRQQHSGLQNLDQWVGGAFTDGPDGRIALTPNAELAIDADGTSECLIAAESSVVQDHWKWSKARNEIRARFK